MVEFSKSDELKTWLDGKDRSVAVVIAARAAMRVLPLTHRIFATRYEEPREKFVFPVFRAITTSRVAAVGPTRDVEQANAAAAYTAYAAYATAYTANAATAAAATAAAYAADAAATNAATYAAAAANAATAAANIWAAVSADAALVERGRGALATAPLWFDLPPEGNDVPLTAKLPPSELADAWDALRAELLAGKDEDWDFWIDWYEDRLNGVAPNEDLERAIVLIPDGVWKSGPKVLNARIRDLQEEFADKEPPSIPAQEPAPPSRVELSVTVSPLPVVLAQSLDVAPNPDFDAPGSGYAASSLPQQQRNIIAVLMAEAERHQITPGVLAAFRIYGDELLANPAQPMLGTLTDMHAIIRSEYNTLRTDDFFIGKGALKKSFNSFSTNHKELLAFFADDTKRETLFARTRVDRTQIDIAKARELADQFKHAVTELKEAGIATVDFETVSYRIADDLKAATYAAPTAPVDAMQANRDVMEWAEIPVADRAIIKALTFSDSLRAKLKEENFTADGWRRLNDVALSKTLYDWGAALARAIFGGG